MIGLRGWYGEIEMGKLLALAFVGLIVLVLFAISPEGMAIAVGVAFIALLAKMLS